MLTSTFDIQCRLTDMIHWIYTILIQLIQDKLDSIIESSLIIFNSMAMLRWIMMVEN